MGFYDIDDPYDYDSWGTPVDSWGHPLEANPYNDPYFEYGEDRPIHFKKKKNTKKWCKGKVGVEHEPVIELNTKHMYGSNYGKKCRPDVWWGCYHHEVCKNCGKELKLFFSSCPDA